MELSHWSYLAAFLSAVALAFSLTPVALRVAMRLQILDRPGGYKVQESPVPYLGGAAIVLAFCMTVVVGGLIARPPSQFEQVVAIVGCAVVLSVVGLVDDLKGLPLWPRIAAQASVGIAMWAVGVRVELFHSVPADVLLTVLWIFGITNAFNLLDNMDGLSAGIATIAAASFFLIALVNEQQMVAALAAALAGCGIGFLRHNFHPARIYMGDAGSLFLGFVLAVVGIKLRFEGPTQVTFLVPILVLGVPILDTTLVVISRLVHGMSPFSGGRDHISHRLVFVGIPVAVAVGLIYAAGVSLGWIALIASRIDVSSAFMLAGLVVVIAASLLVLLSLVPVYENSRKRKSMVVQVVDHEDPAERAEAVS